MGGEGWLGWRGEEWVERGCGVKCMGVWEGGRAGGRDVGGMRVGCGWDGGRSKGASDKQEGQKQGMLAGWANG